MASVLFGLLAVQSLFSGVVARPRCHALSVLSSTTVSDVVSSSSVDLSSSTETESSLTVSTTVSSEDIPSSTESPLTVTTTVSSESDIPSSTDSSQASSTVFSTTTTAPYCDPTPTYLPENCWASIPTACNSLNRTPTLAYPNAGATASACRSALSANGALATAVAGCFQSIGFPQFIATSAYSCVSAAPIYCHSTTASCDPFATPTPLPVNGGFESGDMSPWVEIVATTGVPASNVDFSVTAEQSHSGGKSLKVNFQNLDGALLRWQQQVKLVPGATYEFSYWAYSLNTVSRTGTGGGVTMPGSSPSVTSYTFQWSAANQWTRASTQFVATASFGTLWFQFSANYATTGGGNVVYIDDVALKLV